MKNSSFHNAFMSTDLRFNFHLEKMVTLILTMTTCYCSYILFVKAIFAPKGTRFHLLGLLDWPIPTQENDLV